MASTQTIAVCDASELKDGQMKQVDFGDGKVLLSKIGNDIHATSAFCTHYGAPLAKGVLTSSGRVTCPWHGACFNVCTGDIEDAPAPSALHSFSARVESSDGKVYVTADPSLTVSANKSRSPAPTISINETISSVDNGGVVIVGGGAGGLATIIGLRESGYKGSITLISAEPHAPIDRTKLSKALLTDTAKLEWYSAAKLREQFGVDLRTGARVSGVDFSTKTVQLEGSGAEKVRYDRLVLATGAVPRRLPIPGASLPHVHVLRSVDDTKQLDAVLKEGKRLVVVGSSFIGMELVVAAAGRKMAGIDVIGMTKEPFEAILGEKVGKALRKFHESKGVTFYGSAKCTSIDSTSVTIEAGGEQIVLDADVVVMAVGVAPATDFLKEGLSAQKVELLKDGSLKVDEFLRAKGLDGVYAIGDIATFPEPVEGNSVRIEHWNVAQNHGRAVASGIAGRPLAFNKVPVFWSAQGQQLRYVGHAVGFDDIFIQGDVDAMKFIAYYLKGDKVLAVASMQSDPVAMKASELMRMGKMPSAEKIKSGMDLMSIDISTTGAFAQHK
ncbi:hypothetical protein DL93DRAFT_2081481 [Clavulina sp. PMI_390]|nr:hypothetical protein DL93DRAFT_2081481 [Clavulina sp. PMI_390]